MKIIDKIIIFITLCCIIDISIIAKHQLKILFVVKNFPGGPSAAVINQITGLIDKGINVNIFARKLHGLQSFGFAHIVEQYHLLDCLYLENMPTDIESYDIIYAQSGEIGKYIADTMYKTTIHKPKLITSFRGSDITSYLEANPGAYDTLFRVGEAFLPVCNSFKTILIQNGCPPEKIYVHHTAIDCNLFKYKQRPNITRKKTIKIVSVARLLPKKGLVYAIQAITDLIKQGYKIDYTIVGRGSLKQELIAFIEKRHMQKYIHLIGYKPLHEIPEILDQSQMLILPSIVADNGDSEGIPNVLKEAMACGLPVISTYHSGIPELIKHGESGLLVQEADSRALIKAIKYLINNPKHVRQMATIARKTIEKEYDKDKVNARLIELFSHICAA